MEKKICTFYIMKELLLEKVWEQVARLPVNTENIAS